MEAIITSVRVDTPDGRTAARIERIDVGGGTRLIEGEEHTHPTSTVYHVRLLSPDRMVPDELREVEDYDEAVKLGLRYAEALAANTQRIADLVEDLRV